MRGLLGRAAFWLALGLVVAQLRCSSFSEGPTAGSAPAGIRCGKTATCAVGERCCVTPGTATCAVDCGAASDGTHSVRVFECGRPSDCREQGMVCCVTAGGCGGHFVKSECVRPASCISCFGGGGAQELACDPTRDDECPAGTRCIGKDSDVPYSVCRP